MAIFFRSEKKKYQALCHSFPEYIQYGSDSCHTVYANSIAGFPEYTTGGTVREEGAQIKIEEFYLPGY